MIVVITVTTRNLWASRGKLAIKQMTQQGTHTHTNNKRELKLQGMEGGSLELGNFSLCWCIPFTKRGYLFYLVSYLDDVRPRVNYNEEENPFNVPGSSFILSFYILNSLLIIFSPVFRSTTI